MFLRNRPHKAKRKYRDIFPFPASPDNSFNSEFGRIIPMIRQRTHLPGCILYFFIGIIWLRNGFVGENLRKRDSRPDLKSALRFFPPAGLIPQANHLFILKKSHPSSPFRCRSAGDAPSLSEGPAHPFNGKNPQIFSDMFVISGDHPSIPAKLR